LVGIKTGLWAGRSGVLLPTELEVYLFSVYPQTGCGAHLASYSMSTGDCVRWLRHETNHSPPFVTEVKNEWSYTSTVPENLYGVYRYNPAFLFLVSNGFQSDSGI